MAHEVHVGGRGDLGVGVACVRQASREVLFRAVVGRFVEGLAEGKLGEGRASRFLGEGRREAFEPGYVRVGHDRERSRIHENFHAHVLARRLVDASRAYGGLEVAACATGRFDAREILLQDRRLEERVLVDHAAKESEKLLAGDGGDLLGEVGRVRPVGCAADVAHLDSVDRRTSFGDRLAAHHREQRRSRGECAGQCAELGTRAAGEGA